MNERLEDVTGLVFDIEEFAVFDGPGIRCAVFVKGCPLRCMWCHNPEGLEPHPQRVVTLSLCAHRGACREVCPSPESCIGCGKCDRVCPMSLPVERLLRAGTIEDAECIQCAACADACPKDVLKLRMSRVR